jgi:hypothetical protein
MDKPVGGRSSDSSKQRRKGKQQDTAAACCAQNQLMIQMCNKSELDALCKRCSTAS